MFIGCSPIETPWLALNHVQCRLRAVKNGLATYMNMSSTTREMLFYANKPLYTYFPKKQFLEKSFFFTFRFLSPFIGCATVSTYLAPVLLVGVIFPCKGTASVRSSSTAVLCCSRIERQPSSNHRFGYSAKFLTVYLPFTVLSLLLRPHVKSIPKRRPKGSIRGKKK
jgi:hypothetical protein